MSSASDLIRSLKPFSLEEYSGISSREKLVVYAIKYLYDNNIKTSFDNVCMTAFKLFPEEFKLSNDFPDVPDIAGLNRTLMHLRPSERNYATGKPNTFYELTKSGIVLAEQIKEGLQKGVFISDNTIAKHDEIITKANNKDYIDFINNSYYKEYQKSKNYNLSLVWNIFDVIPFTNLNAIISKIKNVIVISKEKNNETCFELAQKISTDVKMLIEKKKEFEKGVR